MLLVDAVHKAQGRVVLRRLARLVGVRDFNLVRCQRERRVELRGGGFWPKVEVVHNVFDVVGPVLVGSASQLFCRRW